MNKSVNKFKPFFKNEEKDEHQGKSLFSQDFNAA